MDELIRYFTLDNVGKSAAVFNPEKLLWLNQHYIKEGDTDRLARLLIPFLEARDAKAPGLDFVKNVVEDLKSRSRTLVEMADSALFYFQDEIYHDPELAEKYFNQEGREYIAAFLEKLATLSDYTKEGIEKALRRIAEDRATKLKYVIQPIRVALTGKTVSPGIDQVMLTLGRERVRKRLLDALEYTKSAAQEQRQ